jgi:hypothetical protein
MAKKSKSTPTAGPTPPTALPSTPKAFPVQIAFPKRKAKKKKGKNFPKIWRSQRLVSIGRQKQQCRQKFEADLRHIQKHRKTHQLLRSSSKLKPLKPQCSVSWKTQSLSPQHLYQTKPLRRLHRM